MELHHHPSTDHLRPIAREIVSRFPGLFEDRDLEGNRLKGPDGGHYTLLHSLIGRVVDLARSSGDSRGSESTRKHTAYGCKSWAPTPSSSAVEVEELRLQMLNIYQQGNLDENNELLKELLDQSFAELRKIINHGKISVKVMKEDWPLFFTKIGIYTQLIDGKAIQSFKSSLVSHNGKIIGYLLSLQKRIPGICTVHKNVIAAKDRLKSNQPEVFGLMMMIETYFGEDCTDVFVIDDVDHRTLPATPCIISKGSTLTASSHKIALDGIVILEDIAAPEEALCLFLSTFYIFNVKYPTQVPLTMEFLQRSFAGINSKGRSRFHDASKNKSHIEGIHTRVLKLIGSLQDYDA